MLTPIIVTIVTNVLLTSVFTCYHPFLISKSAYSACYLATSSVPATARSMASCDLWIQYCTVALLPWHDLGASFDLYRQACEREVIVKSYSQLTSGIIVLSILTHAFRATKRKPDIQKHGLTHPARRLLGCTATVPLVKHNKLQQH